MSLKINFALVILVLFSLSAMAAEVGQVKGTKALVNLGGTPASPGSEFYAVDAAGKKRAILKIKQVRGDKAVAEVTKGTAQAGMSLKARAGGSAPEARVQDVPQDSSAPLAEERAQRPKGFLGKFLKRGTSAGIVAGLAKNTMSLTAKKGTASEDVTMNGQSFNLLGLYDYDMSPNFTIRGLAGFETFTASGTASNSAVCNGSGCDVNFTYLSFEGSAHYNFMTKKTRAWVGAGAAFMITATKSSSVANLDTSSATNQMLTFGGGADINMGKGTFIPVSLEYGMFPGSSSVKATTLLLHAGYAWRY